MLMCYLGGKIVLMPEWNKRQAVTLIENEKIESISGLSPLTISELLHISDSGHKVRTLRNLNIHGSALSHNFLRRIKEHFPFFNIRTGYGMTETSGSISIASGSELLNNPGTGGQVLPSLEIKVIDHNGQIQPHGKQGEICARGAMVMKRYCADPYKTSTVIDNGWLKTGDAGYLDSGGNLYITGRIEDLIIRGKHFISAGKLEQLAGEHHMIDEAVVFSLPDSEKRQNIVLAALPYKSQKVDKGKLKHELFSRIKNLADDCKIILFDSLPRTASGKVNRDVLRRQISSKL
jgi:acyl-CoA synthetase (AMP-forming)/AMP-acid ligase II